MMSEESGSGTWEEGGEVGHTGACDMRRSVHEKDQENKREGLSYEAAAFRWRSCDHDMTMHRRLEKVVMPYTTSKGIIGRRRIRSRPWASCMHSGNFYWLTDERCSRIRVETRNGKWIQHDRIGYAKMAHI